MTCHKTKGLGFINPKPSGSIALIVINYGPETLPEER